MRRRLLRTVPAVVATAVVGGFGSRPDTTWYAALDKPSWQPPGWLFGPVWTTLYAAIAYGSARGMEAAATPREAKAIERSLWLNLALNTSWSWAFFAGQNPRLALAVIGALNVSNADLVRRTARADRTAAATLLPYAAWVAFATVLNAELVRRNPDA